MFIEIHDNMFATISKNMKIRGRTIIDTSKQHIVKLTNCSIVQMINTSPNKNCLVVEYRNGELDFLEFEGFQKEDIELA